MAGTISTYTPLLGLDGIIGVKSGYTDAAGGCDVVARHPAVHGHPTLLLAAVTGQTRRHRASAQAGLHGLALVNAVQPLIGTTTVLRGGVVAAHVAAAGPTRRRPHRPASVSMLTWPGVQRHPRVPSRAPAERPGPARRAASAPSWSRSAPSAWSSRCSSRRDVPQRSMLQRLF